MQTDVDLRLGMWERVLEGVECDALIVDAPYSAKTHGGHDGGVVDDRRQLSYEAWDALDVSTFVASWAPRTRGWFVSITDTELAPVWARELERAGRYVFSPLAFVAPGSRVRMQGDGPSQWSCWIIVARPRTPEFFKWGTLPGAYVLPRGQDNRRGDPLDVIGGKPLWLMQALVRDYSRPGNLVCDPCAGGATTLLAAAIEGRRAIGAEVSLERFGEAQKRLARGFTPTFLS